MLETVLSHFHFVHLSRKAWEGCVCEFELLYGAQVPCLSYRLLLMEKVEPHRDKPAQKKSVFLLVTMNCYLRCVQVKMHHFFHLSLSFAVGLHCTPDCIFVTCL